MLVRFNLLGIVFFIALALIALWKIVDHALRGESIPEWAEPFGNLAASIAIALAALHFGLLGLPREPAADEGA